MPVGSTGPGRSNEHSEVSIIRVSILKYTSGSAEQQLLPSVLRTFSIPASPSESPRIIKLLAKTNCCSPWGATASECCSGNISSRPPISGYEVNVHKKYISLIASLLLFYGIACSQQFYGGSSARHIALGGGPINPYLRDAMRAHVNPAEISADSNFVWSDLGYLATDGANGGSRYQFLGASIQLTDQIHAGLILNKRESPLYTVDNSTPSLDPIDEMNGYAGSVLGFGAGQFGRPLSPLEIVGSYHDALFDVGGSVSYGGWKNQRSDGGNLTQSARTWRFKAGILRPLSPNAMIFDAAVLLGLNSVDGTYTASGQTSKLSMVGGTELGIDARTEYTLNGYWTLVPRIRWYTFSWGMNQVKNGVTALPDPVSEYSHNEYEIGVGGNYQNENVLVVGGVSYQQTVLESNYKTPGASSKTTITIVDLPKINLGAEIRLASWLVARLGYFDQLASTETAVETGSGKTTSTLSSELPWYGDPNGLSAAQQRLTLGIGINVSGLCFDGTMGEGYFLNGPWPLSGTAQQMFGVVSLSFCF
jgi:hypothetical protein